MPDITFTTTMDTNSPDTSWTTINTDSTGTTMCGDTTSDSHTLDTSESFTKELSYIVPPMLGDSVEKEDTQPIPHSPVMSSIQAVGTPLPQLKDNLVCDSS